LSYPRESQPGKETWDFSRCNRFVVAVPTIILCLLKAVRKEILGIPTLVLSSAKRTVSVLPIGLFVDPY